MAQRPQNDKKIKGIKIAPIQAMKAWMGVFQIGGTWIHLVR